VREDIFIVYAPCIRKNLCTITSPSSVRAAYEVGGSVSSSMDVTLQKGKRNIKGSSIDNRA
jgi:hypothetical protein